MYTTAIAGSEVDLALANNQQLGPLPLNSQLIPQVRSIGILITAETPRGGEMDTSTRIGLRNLGG